MIALCTSSTGLQKAIRQKESKMFETDNLIPRYINN